MENRYSNQRGNRRRFGEENRWPQNTGRYGQGYYDSRENYFGGGRQQFGSGRPESESYRPTSQWRENEGWGSPARPYNPSERFGGWRGDYRPGYQSGSRGGQRFNQPGYSNRQNFGPSYGSSYPESESGYYGNQEDRGWWDKTTDEVSSWFGDEEAERRREMDANYGEFRGRGPRNYKRSDDRIEEDVNDRLTDHDYLDASDIEVQVNNGDVILTGTVETRYQKRLAEDIAEDVSGVSNVENRLRVETSYGDNEYTDTTTGLGTDTQSRAAGENR